MPLMSHGSHRSMSVGEAKEQKADPDHLWASPFVSSDHGVYNRPEPIVLQFEQECRVIEGILAADRMMGAIFMGGH